MKKQQEQGPRGNPAHEREQSVQEVQGYHKQFSEAKHIEWKSWTDSEVFDLVDLRKNKPKNYVTGRWVISITTDKNGQLSHDEDSMDTARIPRQAEALPTARFPCFHKTRISDEMPDDSQQKLGSSPH